METHTPTQTTEFPKTASFKRHQRQSFWQIIAPVGFATLLILVILVLVILRAVGTDAGGQVSQWADTSLIWLILPALLLALLLTLILVGMIYLLAQLLKIIPGFTYNAQYYVGLASGYVESFADKLVAPIIAVKSGGATVSALFGAIFGGRKN
jgi:uncharacterized membrane protein YbhN (UPF0104 family)